MSVIHNVHANPGRTTHTPHPAPFPVFRTGLDPIPTTDSWEHPLRRIRREFSYRDLQLL